MLKKQNHVLAFFIIILNLTACGGGAGGGGDRAGAAPPPVFSITSPTPNKWLSGVATITGELKSTTAITKVEFFLDSVNVYTITGSATTVTFQLDTNPYSAGTHNLTARTTDVNGSVSTTADTQININKTPPVVSIVQPGVWSRGVVNISATVASTPSISKVEFLIGGVVKETAVSSLATPSFQFDTKPYSDGPYVLSIRATDESGLQSTSIVSTKVDNTPPLLFGNIVTYTVSTDHIEYGAATDNYSGMASVQDIVVPGGVSTGVFTSDNWNLHIYSSGHPYFHLRVADAAGNCADYNVAIAATSTFDGSKFTRTWIAELLASGTCP